MRVHRHPRLKARPSSLPPQPRPAPPGRQPYLDSREQALVDLVPLLHGNLRGGGGEGGRGRGGGLGGREAETTAAEAAGKGQG